MLPKKAVESMRFVNSKNLSEYVSQDNQLKSWGGTDDYTFKFEPEQFTKRPQQSLNSEQTPPKKVSVLAICLESFYIANYAPSSGLFKA